MYFMELPSIHWPQRGAWVRMAELFGALMLLGLGARLVYRPDAQSMLRHADALFATGRYYEARTLYRMPGAPDAQLLLRRGMIAAVRGEGLVAGRSFAQALALGVQGGDYDLTRLYQGHVAMQKGQTQEAFGFWRTIAPASPLSPYRHVLKAEAQLGTGDYAAAEASYRAALDLDMARDWRSLAWSRIAALRATSDRDGAWAALAQHADGAAVPPPFIAALLPTAAPAAVQLAAVVAAPPDVRAQQLGQIYLDAGWYALAEAQFAAVGPGPAGLSAQAYAAYARLRAGDRAGGVQRLEALVDAYPNEARARALLALAYLNETDPIRAKQQLDLARTLAPSTPDTHLAWGQWDAAQHDYVGAADEYRRALAAAAPEQRGTYALALARFQLDTTVHVCADGRPAAENAVQLLPNDGGAWTILAEARLACGDAAGARTAAAAALKHAPDSAEAALYLGEALARQGQHDAARTALIAAADMAPASAWRVKAERQLAALGT